jgi:hypothetical protein
MLHPGHSITIKANCNEGSNSYTMHYYKWLKSPCWKKNKIKFKIVTSAIMKWHSKGNTKNYHVRDKPIRTYSNYKKYKIKYFVCSVQHYPYSLNIQTLRVSKRF